MMLASEAGATKQSSSHGGTETPQGISSDNLQPPEAVPKASNDTKALSSPKSQSIFGMHPVCPVCVSKSLKNMTKVLLDANQQEELGVYIRNKQEWALFRSMVKQSIVGDGIRGSEMQIGLPLSERSNKVDAIGRFLTKLKKPTNYDKSIVEEINKFNLKNHINDFANSVTESIVQKFDTCTVLKLLAAVWVTYTDDELRRNIITSLETVLVDKKLEALNKVVGGPEIRASIFRLFFELHMMGFGNSLKLLVQAFTGCVKPSITTSSSRCSPNYLSQLLLEAHQVPRRSTKGEITLSQQESSPKSKKSCGYCR